MAFVYFVRITDKLLRIVRLRAAKITERQVTIAERTTLAPSRDFVPTYGKQFNRAEFALRPVEAVDRFQRLLDDRITALGRSAAVAAHRLKRYTELRQHASQLSESNHRVGFEFSTCGVGTDTTSRGCLTADDLARLDAEITRSVLGVANDRGLDEDAAPQQADEGLGLVLEPQTITTEKQDEVK